MKSNSAYILLNKCEGNISGKEGTQICIKESSSTGEKIFYDPGNSGTSFKIETCVDSCLHTDMQFTNERKFRAKATESGKDNYYTDDNLTCLSEAKYHNFYFFLKQKTILLEKKQKSKI